MDKNTQLADLLKQLFDSGAVTVVRGTLDDNGNVVIPLPIEIDQPLPNPDNPNKTIEKQFFFTLVGMAQWALEHPSASRFEYISPEHVKAHKHLMDAFMNWWYAEHPYMSDAQWELFHDSVKHGLCPACVVEHTADGHHPIGWSWGSEWYLADFYMCLIRALIQHAERAECDMKDKNAPVYIANKAFQLNRVDVTPEIIKAMNERLHETVETREYGVVSAEVN